MNSSIPDTSSTAGVFAGNTVGFDTPIDPYYANHRVQEILRMIRPQIGQSRETYLLASISARERREALAGLLRHSRSLSLDDLVLTSSTPLSTLARNHSVQSLTTKNDYFGDALRSTSPLELDGGHDTTASVDRHFAPEEDIRDAGPRLLLGSLVESQYSSESASTPTHPFHFPSFDPTSTTFQLTHYPFPHDTSNMIDAMAKDPEALLDTQSLNVVDATRGDPSIMVTALITALGLLTNQPSNPKVAVFQLAAAAVSFTLIALHFLHSNTLARTEQRSRELTFGQRLFKYFPHLIFASCWILFLLSVTFTSPKAMTITVSLVVFASIPMACGARLPATLTLVIIFLFGLTFFALVLLVCILPTEWLE